MSEEELRDKHLSIMDRISEAFQTDFKCKQKAPIYKLHLSQHKRKAS